MRIEQDGLTAELVNGRWSGDEPLWDFVTSFEAHWIEKRPPTKQGPGDAFSQDGVLDIFEHLRFVGIEPPTVVELDPPPDPIEGEPTAPILN